MTRAPRLLPLLALAAAAGCNTSRLTSRTDVGRYHALARAAVGPIDPPAWSGATTAANAAFVARLPDGVLVAYTTMERVGTNAKARRPAVTRLVLHDARTGAPRWEASTTLLGEVVLASSEPAIVLMHEAGLSAFDPATGAARWERKLAALALSVDAARNQLLVWSRDNPPEHPVLFAVDLASGKDRWSTPIPVEVAAMRMQLAVAGELAVAVGLRAAIVRADSGALVAAPPLDLGAPAICLAAGGGVILGDVRGRLVRVRPEGAIAWTAETGARTTFLAADGDRLLAATTQDLRLLSLETGREAWRVAGEHAGTASSVGAHVIWSTRPKLVVLDAATGRELAAAPRSAVMQLGGLPDQHLLGDDQLTAVGETGVMAVSLGARQPIGAVLWRLDLHGVWSSRVPGLRWSGGTLPAVASAYHAAPALRLPPSSADTSKRVNPWTVKHDTQGSRMSAAAWDHAITADRLNAQLEVATASLATSMSLLNVWMSALEAQREAWRFAATHRQNALAGEPTALWLASIQGEYLVRPIAWELGQGVLVTDLYTGRWTEVVTGPGELALDDFYLSHAPASLDPGTGALVTLGRAGLPVELTEFPNIRTTARSTLAYRLTDPRAWSPPEEYPARSRVPPPVIALAPAAEKEFIVYRERLSYDRNQVGRIVKGKTTRDEVRRLLGAPQTTGPDKAGGTCVEIWTYGNSRPGGIELDMFEFDADGVVCKTFQIDTKAK